MVSTSSTSARRRSCSVTPRISSAAWRRRAARYCSSGTKRQAQDVIVSEAQRCGMFFVNQRWLGGLLTNFTTIQRSIGRLRELEAMAEDGRYDTLSKKEIARIEKDKRKLQKNLDGIRQMSRLPDAGVRRRHEAREDRGRRGPQAEDTGNRARGHQLRSRRRRLRHSGQRRRVAVDSPVRHAHRRRGHRRRGGTRNPPNRHPDRDGGPGTSAAASGSQPAPAPAQPAPASA